MAYRPPPGLLQSHCYAVHRGPATEAPTGPSNREAVLQLRSVAGVVVVRLLLAGEELLAVPAATVRQVCVGFTVGHHAAAKRQSWYPYHFSLVVDNAEPLVLSTHTDAERREAVAALEASRSGELPPSPPVLRVSPVMFQRRDGWVYGLAALVDGGLLVFGDAGATRPVAVLRLTADGDVDEVDEADPCRFEVRHASGAFTLLATDEHERGAWVEAIAAESPRDSRGVSVEQVEALLRRQDDAASDAQRAGGTSGSAGANGAPLASFDVSCYPREVLNQPLAWRLMTAGDDAKAASADSVAPAVQAPPTPARAAPAPAPWVPRVPTAAASTVAAPAAESAAPYVNGSAARGGSAAARCGSAAGVLEALAGRISAEAGVARAECALLAREIAEVDDAGERS